MIVLKREYSVFGHFSIFFKMDKHVVSYISRLFYKNAFVVEKSAKSKHIK